MLCRMDENGFWLLIENCRPGVPDPDPQLLPPGGDSEARVKDRLRPLSFPSKTAAAVAI
ncbi:hypothetical protein GCM10010187_44090 [Actinomadura coerulea]|nr:hypothetical protein GCM10010187_44090 [Actinomadura coerulea]